MNESMSSLINRFLQLDLIKVSFINTSKEAARLGRLFLSK